MTQTSPDAELVCPECGAQHRPDALFCPIDGARLIHKDSQVGKVLLGQIELREVCGHGSMGTVYLAWQQTMDRQVAVKVLRRKLLRDRQVVKRFEREARAAASLSHPNIITVYLVGETDDGLPFMVMEYIAGQSLEQALDDCGAMPPARAIHIGRQIASALSDAHAQGIVHRDLKPANILLTDKRGAPDFVKVLDFGIAKILRDGEDSSRLTKTGAIFGTPYYLSPEQAAGEDVDHRCDLYSLGVLLFRMLTGRLPFDSAAAVEVLVQHLKEAPPRPRDLRPSIPASLESLVLKALAKQPDERWQSADELTQALSEIADRLYGGGSTLLGVADGERSTPEDGERPRRPSAPMSPVGPITITGPSGTGGTGRSGTGEARPASAPAARASAAPGSDPRFRVPSAGEMCDDSGPEDGAPRTTGLSLFARPSRRGRLLGHLVAALASIAVGAGAGALVYSYQETGAPAPAPGARADAADTANTRAAAADDDDVLPVDGGPDVLPVDATIDAAPPRPASRPKVPPKRVKRAKKPARRKKARPRRPPSRRPEPRPRPTPPGPEPIPHAVPPVGPDPDVAGSDHDPKNKDEIYDLVD